MRLENCMTHEQQDRAFDEVAGKIEAELIPFSVPTSKELVWASVGLMPLRHLSREELRSMGYD